MGVAVDGSLSGVDCYAGIEIKLSSLSLPSCFSPPSPSLPPSALRQIISTADPVLSSGHAHGKAQVLVGTL